MAILERHQNVCVRQSAFLKFHCVGVSYNRAKKSASCNFFDQSFQLRVKDFADNIWSVGWFFRWQFAFADLWPLWIASERNEEIRFSVFSKSCHCIIAFFAIVAVRAGESRGQDCDRAWN